MPIVCLPKQLKTLIIMHHPFRNLVCLWLAAALGLPALSKADVVELINGDRYQGTVVSMTEGFLEFQSEIQGRVKLPRDKVATITLHSPTARKPLAKTGTPPPVAAPLILSGASAADANSAPSTPADAVVQQMRREGIDPKMISQVQEQIFGKGSPEASQKFNQTMAGLVSGQLNIGDIRVQAQNSINQIKDAKKELGGDAGDMLDGYLAILEKFVQQSGTADAGSPIIQSAPAAPPEQGTVPAPTN